MYDLVIIGGGPGGYVAAIRAAQNNMKVALVEKEHLGGVCLNWGCIPTKALLKCSEVNHLFHKAEEYGFQVKDIKFNFEKIMDRSRAVAKQLSSGISHLLKKNKIDVFLGTGKILSSKTVSVEDQSGKKETLGTKNIIIATGARARILPGLEPDGKLVMTYKDALACKNLPKKLLVIGAGAIGVEFASFYKNLGSDVSIVEMQDKVLPLEDIEISQFVKMELEKQKIHIYLNSKTSKLEKAKQKVKVTIDTAGKNITDEYDAVLVAVGVQSNVENIGLENTKVKLAKGNIVTDEWGETDEKGVYAIGDVASAPWLAHKASHEGIICIDKILGKKDIKPLNRKAIPSCVYAIPQVASVGLTEQEASKQGYKVKIGKFPFIGNGKAIAIGETEGFIKTIFDSKTGELLGAHMVGSEVTEMIQGYVIAMKLEATEEELMHTIFPHPTLSEMMQESVLNAFDKAIHI
ncbi:MAG: dihydrolipoyl dehydrogenase [Rickettsiales bacterium]|nr:dihydrolipoyl dehydrogenase [Rickettsiales bacterium]